MTVVAPPSLPAPAGAAVVNGMGELTGKLEIDERGAIETPVYLCGTHAVGTVYPGGGASPPGAGPDNVVLPVVGECDDGDMADSRTVTAGRRRAGARGPRRRGRGGQVGAGTGMICFGFPGGIGTASRGSATTTSACCCSATSATASTSTCSAGPRPEPPASSPTAGLLHRRLRDRRAARAAAAAPAGAAPAARPGARRLLRREGSGEIGLAFSTSTDGEPRRRGAQPATSPPPTRPPTRRSTTAWSPPGPAERLDGTMQEGFPLERGARGWPRAAAQRAEGGRAAARRGGRSWPRR